MRTASFAYALALPMALAVPAQPPIANTSAIPMHFGLLVFDSFQALDVFGPMDVLNTFSLLYNSSMHLSVISATMDPVGTAYKKTPAMNMTHGDFGESILPTTTIKDVLAAQRRAAKSKQHGGGLSKHQDGKPDLADLDVLIIPGGGGTRNPLTEEIAFVKEMYPKVKYVITVCTGATIAARASILDHRSATTNKRSWPWAITQGPLVNWVHTARWVQDGNIWSSSGISAGIDVAYAWLSHVYGDPVSEYISLSSEYRRNTNSTDDPFAAVWGTDAPTIMHPIA